MAVDSGLFLVRRERVLVMFYHLLAHLLTYIPSDLLTYILYFIVSHRPESIYIVLIKKEEKRFP